MVKRFFLFNLVVTLVPHVVIPSGIFGLQVSGQFLIQKIINHNVVEGRLFAPIRRKLAKVNFSQKWFVDHFDKLNRGLALGLLQAAIGLNPAIQSFFKGLLQQPNPDSRL